MNLHPQDPLDTLRNDVALCIVDLPMVRNEHVDRIMQVLASAALDPVRLRAILELIGLEVVGEGHNDGIDVAADGSGDTLGYYVVFRPTFTPEVNEPVLICRVRPQGEQANA